MAAPRLLWGPLSYTTPFPTGQNLKEDQLGLEEGHSHFQPNLQYVDPNTEVRQLRASPLWGFSLSYSWVSLPPSTCGSSQPLLRFTCLSHPQLNFQRPEVVKPATQWEQNRLGYPIMPHPDSDKRGPESPP